MEEWVGGFYFDDEYYDEDLFENEEIYYTEDEKDDEYEFDDKDKHCNKLISIPFVKCNKENLNALCSCGSGKKYKNCCFWKEKNK